jgi:hypothetical protein
MRPCVPGHAPLCQPWQRIERLRKPETKCNDFAGLFGAQRVQRFEFGGMARREDTDDETPWPL